MCVLSTTRVLNALSVVIVAVSRVEVGMGAVSPLLVAVSAPHYRPLCCVSRLATPFLSLQLSSSAQSAYLESKWTT